MGKLDQPVSKTVHNRGEEENRDRKGNSDERRRLYEKRETNPAELSLRVWLGYLKTKEQSRRITARAQGSVLSAWCVESATILGIV